MVETTLFQTLIPHYYLRCIGMLEAPKAGVICARDGMSRKQIALEYFRSRKAYSDVRMWAPLSTEGRLQAFKQGASQLGPQVIDNLSKIVI